MKEIKYINNDVQLDAAVFINLLSQIWPGNYYNDIELVQKGLSKTINITAWDDGELVGCLRILTDGWVFGTIPEILVLPRMQRKGIGKKLMEIASDITPTGLFFGGQPQNEVFFDKLGCKKGMQSYVIPKRME